MAHRMIPALWLRLVVLIGFIAFMAWERLWILVVIGVILLALTAWQLLSAHRQRAAMEES
ncbi:hypothetical protein [Corynebacterium pacaense]|uniref:hypothetical protein n=1 Tax=Corynebacterium pacaense TaxID=1816684 RepID=UPI0009BAF5B2|nr:hypothetical protein [Corynebacterium pacaense]